MFTVTLDDYLAPHREKYGHLLGPDMIRSAERMVDAVNSMLSRVIQHGIRLEASPITGTLLTSGWRPAAYNATIPNASPSSLHIFCKAADLYDPHGEIDEWALDEAGREHGGALGELGLWLEHPAATRRWCHVQLQPPRSGRRVFLP